MHWWSDWSFGHMIGMGLLWIALLVAVVALVSWLINQSRARDLGSPSASPREILRQRYARGEIDAEEYRARIDELEQS